LTPAARVAAVIEILTQIEDGRRPADEVVRQWGRRHRFAGSKDRRAISTQLYAVLRRRGLYAKAAGTQPRSWVLAHLVLGDGRMPHDIAALFSGDGYAPPALTPKECALVRELSSTGRQELPAYDVPDFLLPELTEAFGADLPIALAALDAPAPLDLRVNTLKTTRADAATALAAIGIETQPTPHAKTGLRVLGTHQIAGTRAYKDGHIEPMDEGSQIAAAMVDAKSGMQVADLCAGGGGKTLALAAAMGNRGQIYATDSDAHRLRQLAPRMKRAGARNIHPLTWPQDGAFGDLDGTCDRVLLDVPCSGSGAWRRRPELKWRITAADIDRLTTTQDALLGTGAALVKPGGHLVYVTCSVLPVENERRITAFIQRNPRFKPITEGHAGIRSGSLGTHLAPHTHATDGFFISRLHNATL